MRKSLILFVIPFFAFAQNDRHIDPAACQQELTSFLSAAASLEILSGMYDQSVTLNPRKSLSDGDTRILGVFNKAVANWAAVVQQSPAQTDYQKQMYAAIRSALTKHFPLVWNKKIKRPQDMSRMMHILEQIAALDPRNPEFGLFKIQRLIQQRYALKQYIECREI